MDAGHRYVVPVSSDILVVYQFLLYRPVRAMQRNWHGSVRFCTVPYGSVRFCTVLYSAVRFCTVLYGSVRFYTFLYGSVQSKGSAYFGSTT